MLRGFRLPGLGLCRLRGFPAGKCLGSEETASGLSANDVGEIKSPVVAPMYEYENEIRRLN